MSTRSDSAGEAKPLTPSMSATSLQSHICYITLPCLLIAFSARDLQQETPREHKTAEIPKLDGSFMYLETKEEEMM